MFVFYDPVPISQNPTRYRIAYTARGDREVLTAGRTDWIEVADQEIDALEAWVVEGGAMVLANLGPYRRRAISRINSRAGEKRLEFITDIPGQQMLYAAKEEEAKSYLAQNPAPTDLAAYPLMAAEVGPGLTAATPLALAQLWMSMAAQWRAMAAMIEQVRLQCIYAIETAPDRAYIDGVVVTFMSAMEQMQP